MASSIEIFDLNSTVPGKDPYLVLKNYLIHVPAFD